MAPLVKAVMSWTNLDVLKYLQVTAACCASASDTAWWWV